MRNILQSLSALLTTGLFLISFSLHAQEYILDGELNGQTIQTCGGVFYDSGGANDAYGNNEDFTVTFCAADQEECIQLVFDSFSTESNWDFLEVYDGPDATAMSLGSFSGQDSPGEIIGSGSCLTFQFTSDSSSTDSGWSAEISCQCDSTISDGFGNGCPNIDVGPDYDVLCDSNCVTLNANVLETGLTDQYAVSAIEYNPPYPFDAGTGFSIGTDDVWSDGLVLPFNFCYFGNTYNEVVVGSNGLMSFNVGAYAGGFCPWAFTADCPNPVLPLNSIFGVYHDIDPNVCGDAKYAILGEAPCRVFVLNFDDVCHFSCNELNSTTQVVLYETTNIIEVYVQNKPTCSGWNSGNAVIGIQNADGSQGYVAPGRQTGPWTASEEAWRFTPDGVPNFEVSWFDSDDNLIGNGMSLEVCVPPTGTSYFAEVLYTSCDGSLIAEFDTLNIGINLDLETELEVTQVSCGDNCDGVIEINPLEGDAPYSYDIGNGPQDSNVFDNLCPGIYTITVVDINGCTDYVTVEIEQPDVPNPGEDNAIFVCETDGPINMTDNLNGNPDSDGQWYNPNMEPVSAVFDPAQNESGAYTYTVGASPCDVSATLTIQVVPSVFEEVNAAICEGETYTLPDGTQTNQGGTFEHTLTSSVTGCDSIVTTNLEVNPTYDLTVEAGICGSATVTLPDGTEVSTPGEYEVTLPTVAGCDSTITTIVSGVSVDAGEYETICPPEYPFNFSIEGTVVPMDPDATVTWSGSSELGFANENSLNTVVSVAEGGTYTILLTDSRCPDTPDSTTIMLMTNPTIDFPDNIELCVGETYELDPSLTGDFSPPPYIWGDSLLIHQQEMEGTLVIDSDDYLNYLNIPNLVTLIVPAESPCIPAQSSVYVEVIDCEIIIPNIFTPNGDGTNDTFEITGIENFPNSRMIILNRWGKVVYESDGYGQPFWNGTHYKSGAELSDGVYYYELIVNRLDEVFTGTITITRD